jgi:hypothetical protein
VVHSLKQRLREKIDVTRRQFKEPAPSIEWQKHWGSSHYCCLCNKMACSDIKFCQYCDNVAHRLCIMENANARKHRQQRMRAQTMNSYEASHINHHNNLHKRPPKDHSEFDIKAQLQLPVDRFLCAVCEDSRNADRQFFKGDVGL